MSTINTAAAGPLDLARHTDPAVKDWASSQVLSDLFTELLDTEDQRISVHIAAQQGLTTLIKWAAFWWLCRRPADHIVIASYSDRVAAKNRRDLTRIVHAIGNDHGFSHTAAGWTAADGGTATFVAAGGPIARRYTNLLIVDSPLRSQADAERPEVCMRISDWLTLEAGPWINRGGHIVFAAPDWAQSALAAHIRSETWQHLHLRSSSRC